MVSARIGLARFIGNTAVGTALLLGVSVLAACSTAPKLPIQQGGGFGTLPKAAGSAVRGGTVSFGLLPGATPQWILPITPAAQSTSFTINDFQRLMWRPLSVVESPHVKIGRNFGRNLVNLQILFFSLMPQRVSLCLSLEEKNQKINFVESNKDSSS